jgi:hypothetical protein
LKVVVPFVQIAPGVREALAATGHEWEELYVGDSDESYFNLLSGLWTGGEGFIVIEHDVIVRPDTLDELVNCECSWGCFPVPYLGGAYAGMACVKFAGWLTQQYPDAMQQVGTMSNADHLPKHFCTIDSWLQMRVLPGFGLRRHEHGPVLGHYRTYVGSPWPTHGCRGPRPTEET